MQEKKFGTTFPQAGMILLSALLHVFRVRIAVAGCEAIS